MSRQGVDCAPFDGSAAGAPVILIGSLEEAGAGDASWQALLQAVDRGCTAVFLSPLASKQGDDAVARLPLLPRGRWYAFNDWLYHKECVAKAHPVFRRDPSSYQAVVRSQPDSARTESGSVK